MLRRLATLGWKICLSNVRRLELPYKLTYAVTTRCNSKCRHCLAWQQPTAEELTLEEICRFAHENSHWSWVDFTGGEPTLRKDFVEIVGAFLKANPRLLFIHFPTNGLQPDRIVHVCEGILAMSPPRFVVTVSIDGTPSVHDAIRGVKGGFVKACQTLLALRGMNRLAVHAGMTLYPENLQEIDHTIEALQDTVPGFNPRHLHVNIPHASDHFYHNTEQNPSATPEMTDAIRRFMKRRGMPRSPFEWVERLYQKRIPAYVATQKCPQDCAALMSSCFLGATGTVYPCSMWNLPLGNIRDTGHRLPPLLATKAAQLAQRQLLRKACPNCWTPCEAYQTLAANVLPLCGSYRRKYSETCKKTGPL